MPEDPSQRLAVLNSKRQFQAAIRLYEEYAPYLADSHFHYQGALAYLMLNRSADDAIKRLKIGPGFTDTMHGDLNRDLALQLIRNRTNLKKAQELLVEAFFFHENDKQRHAIDMQAQARLEEAEYKIGPAYRTIRQALDSLFDMGDSVDRGWLANTAFHGVRLAIKSRQRRHARLLAGVVLSHDPSWKKKLGAIAMAYFPGETGVAVINRLH